MNKIILFIIGLAVSLSTFGQTERKYSTYYYQRTSLFEQLPTSSDDILFIGNSITDGGEWSELFQDPHVKNRGISGDTTWGTLLIPIIRKICAGFPLRRTEILS